MSIRTELKNKYSGGFNLNEQSLRRLIDTIKEKIR